MTDNRPGWDKYYLGIAKAVSVRGECTRRQVGAILVNKHNRHRASGYNGGYSGGPSCLKGECPRGLSDVPPGSSYDTGAGVCIALHAEQNLVAEASPEDLRGGKVYITDEPCDGCLRTLKGTGVVEIIWPEGVLAQVGRNEWTLYSRRKPGRATFTNHPEPKKELVAKDVFPNDPFAQALFDARVRVINQRRSTPGSPIE